MGFKEGAIITVEEARRRLRLDFGVEMTPFNLRHKATRLRCRRVVRAIGEPSIIADSLGHLARGEVWPYGCLGQHKETT
jgi:hypothetical protein